MVTSIGSDNLLSAYTHVAHDVRIGNHTVLSHGATLGGHVLIEDYAVVGAHCGIHQFCRVGRFAMIGGYSVVTQDVLPFATTVSARENKIFGANRVGLERRGYRDDAIEPLQTAFRLLTRAGLNTTQAMERIRAELPGTAELDGIARFHCAFRARIHQVKYGLIAGNGRFPILALQTARLLGHEIVAIGIEEEASREIEPLAARTYWISLGELSKLIDILKREGIEEIMMTGQVKHTKIFSAIRPDWRLAKLLFSLREKNTDALIGGVAKVLADEGIRLVDSTLLLKPLLAGEGVLTRRKPDTDESRDINYGRRIANSLAAFDVGQSVAIAGRACVALEAMEGTDAMLRRAAGLTNGKPLRLVKVSRRRKHLLFDVPVAGLETVRVMKETNTTALAVDAGRTLFLDKEQLLAEANDAGITMIGIRPQEPE